MKYIFFLLAIATIIAGIPLEERQTSSICTNPHFPVWKSSYCRTMTVMANVCESQDFPGTYQLVDKPCQPDSTCVDFVRPEKSDPIAVCITNENKQSWNNDRERGVICGKKGSFKLNENVLTFGMTTYDTNANPIQVNYLDVSVNNNALKPTINQNHYSTIYKNYVANQVIEFCFGAGSNQFVTAVAGVLGLSGTNNELTVLSLE